MPEQRQRRWFSRKDFYSVLGLDSTADEAAIKKAYRSAALRWHPDKNRGGGAEKEAESKFKEIAEAYEVLSDKEKRRSYDASLHPQRHPTRHTHFHYSPRSPLDVFQEFFGTRDPFAELFADFFGNHHHHEANFPRKQRVFPFEGKGAFFAPGFSDGFSEGEENNENDANTTTFSFTAGKPGQAAAARKTSTSTKHVNGKKIVTRKTEEEGKETVEVLEDGFLTSRIVTSMKNPTK